MATLKERMMVNLRFSRSHWDSTIPGAFRIMTVAGNPGTLLCNGTTQAVIPPLLLCLHPGDTLEFSGLEPAALRVLEFHPNLVNSKLTLGALMSRTPFDSPTDELDADLFIPVLKRFNGFSAIYKISPAGESRLYQVLDNLESHLPTEGKHWGCRTRAWLIELLFLLTEVTRQTGSRVLLPPVAATHEVEPILEFLVHRYHEPLSLEQIARACGTNRTTLNLRFRQATGMTVLGYVGQMRIQVAQALLQDTKLPVSEVAGRVGYENLSHFGRLFKRVTGKTPSEYRIRK